MSLQLDIPCDDDTAITTKRAQGPRLQAMPSHYSLNRDPSTPLPLLQSDTDLCSNLLDAILENEDMHKMEQQYRRDMRNSIDLATVDDHNNDEDITQHDITQSGLSGDISPVARNYTIAYDIDTNTGSTQCTAHTHGTTSSNVTNLTISISPADQFPSPHPSHPSHPPNYHHHNPHPPYPIHHGGHHKKLSSRGQYEMVMTPMSPSNVSLSRVSLNSLNSLSKASHRSSVIDMLTSSAAHGPNLSTDSLGKYSMAKPSIPPPPSGDPPSSQYYQSRQSTRSSTRGSTSYTTPGPSPFSPLDRYNQMVASGEMDVEESLPDDEKENQQNLAELARNAENQLLEQHGFVKVAKLCDTLQGVVYKAKRIVNPKNPNPISPTTSSQSIQSVSSRKSQKVGDRRSALEQYGKSKRKTVEKQTRFVSIKKTSRNLYDRKISYVDESTDMTYCIEEDVVEEGRILKHLTVDHHLNDGHIVKYIDFFQSKTDYYLVTEHVDGNCTLRDFIEAARNHIDDGRLEINDYIKVIRYLFWQLFATIHWLHQDIKCCHLNLSLECVLLENCNFIDSGKGSVSVNNKINAKLSGFGVSKLFKEFHDGARNVKRTSFTCFKGACPSLVDDVHYQPPNVLMGMEYDGRMADVWALGMMLYHCVIFEPLFDEIVIEEEDPKGYEGSGYWAATTGNVLQYINMNNLQQFTNAKLLSLIHCLLNPDETKRLNSLEVLQHKWFKAYYTRYERKNKGSSSSSRSRSKSHRRKQSKHAKQKDLNKGAVAQMGAYRF